MHPISKLHLCIIRIGICVVFLVVSAVVSHPGIDGVLPCQHLTENKTRLGSSVSNSTEDLKFTVTFVCWLLWTLDFKLSGGRFGWWGRGDWGPF